MEIGENHAEWEPNVLVFVRIGDQPVTGECGLTPILCGRIESNFLGRDCHEQQRYMDSSRLTPMNANDQRRYRGTSLA